MIYKLSGGDFLVSSAIASQLTQLFIIRYRKSKGFVAVTSRLVGHSNRFVSSSGYGSSSIASCILIFSSEAIYSVSSRRTDGRSEFQCTFGEIAFRI